MDGVDVGLALVVFAAVVHAVHAGWSWWTEEGTAPRLVPVPALSREDVMAMPESALTAMPVMQEAVRIVVAAERRWPPDGVPRPRHGE